MKLHLFIILFCLCGFLVHGQGYLRAEGERIVDRKGHEVFLRGMGLGGWMLQEPYMLQLSGVAANQGEIKGKIAELIGAAQTARFYSAWLKNDIQKIDID